MTEPATTKMSSKGQVVIPEEIRNRLGLKPGTQFVLVAEGDEIESGNRIWPPRDLCLQRLLAFNDVRL